MQAYRLEMGSRFGIKDNRNLYEFWEEKSQITLIRNLALNQRQQDFL